MFKMLFSNLQSITDLSIKTRFLRLLVSQPSHPMRWIKLSSFVIQVLYQHLIVRPGRHVKVLAIILLSFYVLFLHNKQ